MYSALVSVDREVGLKLDVEGVLYLNILCATSWRHESSSFHEPKSGKPELIYDVKESESEGR